MSTAGKVILGVVAAILLGGVCAAGGCFLLARRAKDAAEQAVIAARVAAEQEAKAQAEADSARRRNLDVAFVRGERNGDWLMTHGKVTNRNRAAVTYWQVGVAFKNKAGVTVDTDMTNSTNRLPYGASTTFEIMTRYQPGIVDVAFDVQQVTTE